MGVVVVAIPIPPSPLDPPDNILAYSKLYIQKLFQLSEKYTKINKNCLRHVLGFGSPPPQSTIRTLTFLVSIIKTPRLTIESSRCPRTISLDDRDYDFSLIQSFSVTMIYAWTQSGPRDRIALVEDDDVMLICIGYL